MLMQDILTKLKKDFLEENHLIRGRRIRDIIRRV